MRIAAIRFCRIQIPFKKAFKHAARKRSATDNIVAATRLENGIWGYGEGLARDYVTGETSESVMAALKQLNPRLFNVDLKTIESVVEFLEAEILSQKNLPQDRGNNTARCALELSLLDAYCRALKKNFSEVAQAVLRSPAPIKTNSEVYYDGILSLGSSLETSWAALKMKLFQFKRLKVKAGPGIGKTLRALGTLRKIVGNQVDLRIDANGAWTLEEAVEIVRGLEPYGISCIEQPLPHSECMKMQALKKNSSIPLMLDESLCSMEDAERALRHQLCDLFNLRLSKCGGFILCLKLARLARENGLGCQLGCMVGETGILSAAGRRFAELDGRLRYLEGSYDRYLLKDNVIEGDISFGKGGKAQALEGYGLGVRIHRSKMKRYTVAETNLFG